MACDEDEQCIAAMLKRLQHKGLEDNLTVCEVGSCGESGSNLPLLQMSMTVKNVLDYFVSPKLMLN